MLEVLIVLAALGVEPDRSPPSLVEMTVLRRCTDSTPEAAVLPL